MTSICFLFRSLSTYEQLCQQIVSNQNSNNTGGDGLRACNSHFERPAPSVEPFIGRDRGYQECKHDRLDQCEENRKLLEDKANAKNEIGRASCRERLEKS